VLARLVGLPPLVGFLATGFLLNAQGITSSDMLQKLADLGITLLLFTVGLKLVCGELLVKPRQANDIGLGSDSASSKNADLQPLIASSGFFAVSVSPSNA
jgi:predicted Kef-type K+ transport protein